MQKNTSELIAGSEIAGAPESALKKKENVFPFPEKKTIANADQLTPVNSENDRKDRTTLEMEQVEKYRELIESGIPPAVTKKPPLTQADFDFVDRTPKPKEKFKLSKWLRDTFGGG